MAKSIGYKSNMFDRLFPKPPSREAMACRRKETNRRIVSGVSTGSFLLQKGKYVTKADIAERKQHVLTAK